MHLFSGTRQPIPTATVNVNSATELAQAIPRTGLCAGCGLRACAGKASSPAYCLAAIKPGGRRRKADVTGTDWLVLDIDYGEPPDELEAYERVVVRTHSGGYHVLVRLARTASAAEYEATIAPWLEKGADAAAKDISRALYAPHASAAVAAYEGEPLGVSDAVALAVAPPVRAPQPGPRALPWADDDMRRVLLDEPEHTNEKAGHLGAALGYRGWPEDEAQAYVTRMLGAGSRHERSAMTAWAQVTGGDRPHWDGAKQLSRDHGLRMLGDSAIERAAPGWLRHNPHDSSRPWFVYRNGVWGAVAAAEVYAELGRRCPHILALDTPGKRVAARSALLKEHEQHIMLETDLDPDPYVLCAPNGLIDLRTGLLGPHSPEALCSRCTGYGYDSTIATEGVARLLLDWCNGNKEVAEHLRMLVGYTITGLASERFLGWLHGPPGTAKSSCADLLAAVLGTYAAQGVPAATWLDVPRKPADSIRATRGCRLVTSSELKGKAWDEDAILPFCGGEDAIRAEGKYKAQIQWKQQCKLWVTSNTEPAGASAALQDRAHVIPFERQYDADPVFKRTLPDKYGPAFLAWAVEAAGAYLAVQRLPERPEAVRAATQEATEDEFGAWIKTLERPASTTRSSVLFDAWSRVSQGAKPHNLQAFGKKMREFSRRYPKLSRKDGVHYENLAVEPLAVG